MEPLVTKEALTHDVDRYDLQRDSCGFEVRFEGRTFRWVLSVRRVNGVTVKRQSHCTTHGRDTVICVDDTEHIGLIKEKTSGITEPRNRRFLLQVHDSPNWHRPRYPSGVDLQVLEESHHLKAGGHIP